MYRIRSAFISGSLLAVIAVISMPNHVRADYATAVLADNPLGYWRFNEADGDTATNSGTEAGDYDGTYFDGSRIPQGPFTLVDGRTADLGADNLAFQVGEDIDEYMTVEESILSGLSEFTMTGWVNPGFRAENRVGLFGQNDAIEFGFINPNQIQLWTPSGQVLNYVIDPDNEIPEDTWFHIGAVGTGDGLQLYLNGEQVLNSAGSYGVSTFPLNIAGGGVYDPTGNQYTGTLDEVAFFDSALDADQIAAHVNAAKTAGGDYAATVLGDSPVGYWGLNEAAGEVAANAGVGGDDLNGTYTGGDQTATGPNETYPGFADGNTAFSAEAPDDGFISVPGSPASNLDAFTLSGWIKPGFIENDRVGLFGQNDALEFGFINPTTIQMWTPGGGFVNFDIIDEVEEDVWVHIAAVGTGDELVIYIDGEEVISGGGPVGGDPVDSYGDSDFFFNVGGGGVYDGSGNQFTGILDEVAMWDSALSPSQIKAQFEAALEGGTRGDYNNNGSLDAGDLDIQSQAIKDNDLAFDENGDGVTDIQDRVFWVNELKNTWMGDADLNGEFDSSDFVIVFGVGKYETGQMALWAEGDWNADMVFDTSDFVVAFGNGGFEMGQKPGGVNPAVAAVPEPSALVLFGIGLLLVARVRRK